MVVIAILAGKVARVMHILMLYSAFLKKMNFQQDHICCAFLFYLLTAVFVQCYSFLADLSFNDP